MKTKLTAPTESVVVQHNSLDNYSSLKRETVCINIMSHNKSNSKQKNFVSEDRTDDLPRTFAKEESITNKKTVYAEYRTNCMDVIESYEDEDDTKIGGGKKKNNR